MAAARRVRRHVAAKDAVEATDAPALRDAAGERKESLRLAACSGAVQLVGCLLVLRRQR